MTEAATSPTTSEMLWTHSADSHLLRGAFEELFPHVSAPPSTTD